MNFNTPRAARAFLQTALPLCAVGAMAASATAQEFRSSITSFDKFGNPVVQATSGDPNRSSVTSFDKEGNPVINYTSPPVVSDKLPGGGTAPNPNPGIYNRFGYTNTAPFGQNYFNPGFNYGYPAPVYPPAYQLRNQSLPSNLNVGSLTIIPLTPGYAYPAPYAAPAYPYPAPYGYPVPTYGYPAAGYGYPAAGFPYGYGANYGYGNGSYSSNTTGYGLTFGRGGFSASIGGNNTTSQTTTTFSVR